MLMCGVFVLCHTACISPGLWCGNCRREAKESGTKVEAMTFFLYQADLQCNLPQAISNTSKQRSRGALYFFAHSSCKADVISSNSHSSRKKMWAQVFWTKISCPLHWDKIVLRGASDPEFSEASNVLSTQYMTRRTSWIKAVLTVPWGTGGRVGGTNSQKGLSCSLQPQMLTISGFWGSQFPAAEEQNFWAEFQSTFLL